MSNLVRFDFHGDQLDVVQFGDIVWISVSRVCNALGIDPKNQREKLAGKPWAMLETLTAFDGVDLPGASDPAGQRRTFLCIHLDSLPMWLATIDAGRVAEAARPKLQAFQRECARVLRDHFLGARQAAQAPDGAALARLLAEALATALAPLVARVAALEGGGTTVCRSDSAWIRTEAKAIARMRSAFGLAPSERSAITWVHNRARAFVGWTGAGRTWANLPASRFAEVRAELAGIRRETENVGVELRKRGQLALPAVN